MIDQNQTNLNRKSGNVIKQGDTSSIFRYELILGGKEEKLNLTGPAKVQLIHENKGYVEIPAELENNEVSFQLEKALPTGKYIVEVEVDGYIFPSSNTETITVNENLGKYVSDKAIELYSLKELVQSYVGEKEDPDLLLFYNLGKI